MNFQNIFDAHAHYDDAQFDIDRDVVLSALPQKGVCGIVNNAVDLKTAQISLNLAHKYEYIYAALGFHPENITDVPTDWKDSLKELLKDKKAVAIGETGLDYHWDTPREIQFKYFEEQLQLANELKMPIVVHDREAHADTLDFIKKYRPEKCLVHCYSGSAQMLKDFLKLGCYISLGGVLTFKNAKHSLECVASVPLENLMLETDAPYLSPVPFRGKRNTSDMIIYAAQKISELRDIPTQTILDITCKNAEDFYNIKH